MTHLVRTLSLIALCTLCHGGAQATLVGSTVDGALVVASLGTSLGSTNAVVGPGVEFPFSFPSGAPITADFSETTLELSYTARSISIGSNMLWSFALDPLLKFDSILETTDTFVNGASLVSFNDNLAVFRLADQRSTIGTRYSALYNITVSEIQGTPIPEPGSIALIGLGLAGLALSRKRK